jgi:hypothetical protein
MCAPRVTRHTSIGYSSVCRTRVNMVASIFFTVPAIRAFRSARSRGSGGRYCAPYVLQAAPLWRNSMLQGTWNFLGVVTAEDGCCVPYSEDSLFFLSIMMYVTGFKSNYLHRTFCFRVRSPEPWSSLYLRRHVQTKDKLSLYRPVGLREIEAPRISGQFAWEGGKAVRPSHAPSGDIIFDRCWVDSVDKVNEKSQLPHRKSNSRCSGF